MRDSSDDKGDVVQVRFVCVTHKSCVIMIPGIILICWLVVSGMFLVNLSKSKTMLEQLCWSIWWLIDLSIVPPAAVDIVLFPGTWIMTAISYLFDVFHLQRLLGETVNDGKNACRSMDHLSHCYPSNERKIQVINQSCGYILSCLTLFTTSVSCLLFFIGMTSDNWFFAYCTPPIGAALISFNFALQWLAGYITSHAGRHVYISLNCILHLIPSDRVTDRHQLLQLMDDCFMDMSSPGMRSASGQRYTSCSFYASIVEAVIQLFLLITFSAFLHLISY